MARRAYLTTASIAAAATLANNNVTTPDDNFRRHVRSIWVTPQTAGVIVTLRKAGYQVEAFDASRCAAGNTPVDVDEEWPATIPISFDIFNGSGGAVVPTVVIAYEPVNGRNG